MIKMRAFLLTVFLTICFSVSAQVDAFQEDIIKYLNSNGTYQQYDKAFDEMFVVLQKNFETANVPNSVWQNLKNDRKEHINEVIKFLTFAYRKHFSQEEISQLYQVYSSEAGKKMQVDPTTLSEKENKELATHFSSPLGKKVDRVRNELAEDVSEISGHWSRDLFASKMSSLIKMGYAPQ